MPMDESIIIRPADSNEVETAKLMLQIKYYLDEQPPNWLNSVVDCAKAGTITADAVLNAREL